MVRWLCGGVFGWFGGSSRLGAECRGVRTKNGKK